MRKLTIFLLLIFISLTAACGKTTSGEEDKNTSSANNQQLKEIVVAEPNHQLGYFPMYLALQNGYFEEEGLDLKMLLTGGGQHVNAVLTGNADAFIGGPEWNAFALVREGGDSKVVKAVSGLVHRGNVYLVGKPGTTMPTDPEKLKELVKGKTFVVGVNGSTTNSIPRVFIKSLGLDPDKDVTLVAVETGNIISTFNSMKADFAVGVEPNLSQGIKEGIYSEPLVNFPDKWGAYSYSTLNVSEELIETDPDLVQKLVNGLYKAFDFIEANKEEAIEVAVKEFKEIDPDIVEMAVTRSIEDGLWDAKNLSEESFIQSMEIVVEAGKLDKVPSYASLVEDRFFKNVKEE